MSSSATVAAAAAAVVIAVVVSGGDRCRSSCTSHCFGFWSRGLSVGFECLLLFNDQARNFHEQCFPQFQNARRLRYFPSKARDTIPVPVGASIDSMALRLCVCKGERCELLSRWRSQICLFDEAGCVLFRFVALLQMGEVIDSC